MLLFCPKCDAVVEILGATRALTFRCEPCDVALEPCQAELQPEKFVEHCAVPPVETLAQYFAREGRG